jgi:predicted RNase H-like HicB family nuclease
VGRTRAKATKAPRAKGSSRGLDRPIVAEIRERAARAVRDYQIILTNEEGQWYGRGLEMPHVFGDGVTPAKCIESTREALTAAVGYMLEKGQTPPSPAKQGKRTTQVNVRLTVEEKAILEGTARRKGFQGLADFIRASALESAR